MKTEFTLEEAVSFLNYVPNWDVDMDTIAMDLSAKYFELYNQSFKCFFVIEFELFILKPIIEI